MTETHDEEDWLDIEDFPNYEVSSHGRVRNASTGYILSQHPNGRGKVQVVMQKDGKNTARAVHKLVATAFISPPPDGAVAIHLDMDCWNNHISNLDYKPLWFANARTRQHHRTVPRDPRPIRAIKTGVVYSNALECAKEIGGLENLVLMAAQSYYKTPYKGTSFEFVTT